MITVKDIEKLAELARLKISDEEKKHLASEIESILTYVSQIKDAASRGTQEVSHHRNVMRLDSVYHESALFTEAILKEAPDREGDYIKVKKILS